MSKDTLKRKSYGSTVSSRRMRRKTHKRSPTRNELKKVERKDDDDDDSFTIHFTQEFAAAGAGGKSKKSPKRNKKAAKIKVKPLKIEKRSVSSSKKSPKRSKSPKKQEPNSKREQILSDLKRAIQSNSVDAVETKLAKLIPAFARTPNALFDSVPIANLPTRLEDNVIDALMDIISIFAKEEAFVSVFSAALLFQARKSIKITKKFLDVLNKIDSTPSHFISLYLTKLADFCIAESVTGSAKLKKTKLFQRGVKIFHKNTPSFSSEDGLYSEGVKICDITSVHVSEFSLSFLSHNEIVFLRFDDSMLIKVDANQRLIELISCNEESSIDPLTIFITEADFSKFIELLQASKYAKLASFDTESGAEGGSVMTSDLPAEVNTAYLWNNMDYTQHTCATEHTNATDNDLGHDEEDNDANIINRISRDECNGDDELSETRSGSDHVLSTSSASAASNDASLSGSNPSQGGQVSRDVSTDVKISNTTQTKSQVTESDDSEAKSSSKYSRPPRISPHARTKQVTPTHQNHSDKSVCEYVPEAGHIKNIESPLVSNLSFPLVDHAVMHCFLSTSKIMSSTENVACSGTDATTEAITGKGLAITKLLSSLRDNVLPIQNCADKLLSFESHEDVSLVYKDDVRVMLKDIMRFSESLSTLSQKWGDAINNIQTELSTVLLNIHDSKFIA